VSSFASSLPSLCRTNPLTQPAALAFRPHSLQCLKTIPSRSISGPSGVPVSNKNEPPAKEEPRHRQRVVDAPAVDPNDPLANPVMDRFLQKYDKKIERPPMKTGEFIQSPTSLFKPEFEIPGYKEGMSPKQLEKLREKEKAREAEVKEQRERELYAQRLDPVPEHRRRYERRTVIKDVTKHHRVTKAIKLARTERQLRWRSRDLPGSTKKMTRIMHLIVGKTVEEALVQLRFSPKRIARDVLKGLQIARDEAMTRHGMGLGASASPLTPESSQPYLADGSNIRPWKKGQLIELKDGTKKRVHDPSEMYIDQAWVGKGTESRSPEFRARGRINMLTHRSSSMSVVSMKVLSLTCTRFLGGAEGRKDATAPLGGDPEEARQSQAVGSAARSPNYHAEAVLPVVVS
jgi:ribosomal protein L22